MAAVIAVYAQLLRRIFRQLYEMMYLPGKALTPTE